MKLTWHGHGSWLIETAEQTIVLDPFFNDSPTATCKADDISADVVLISHGHFDHVADAASIANRNGATLVAIFEIAEWFREKHQVANTIGMNLGGWTELPFGRLKMTPALHSSQLPDGSYGGEPAGYVIEAAGQRVYFACDTALFRDMELIGALGLDAAVLPIGDHFTMGIDDSVQATQWLKPRYVLPAHYNTWPPIAQDVGQWAERIKLGTDAIPVTLAPGEAFEVTE